jgi:hypothetical protein
VRLYLYAGIALAVVMAFAGWTMKIRSDEAAKWRPKLEAAQKLAKGWETSFRASEGLRAKEAATARQAVDAVQLQCDARVKQARASAKVIRGIINAPIKLDAGNCPIRPLVGADVLRDALQPH